MNCSICNKELTTELESTRSFHFDCNHCIYCGNEVGADIIKKLLAEGITTPRHSTCHDAKIREEFKSRPVVITQEKLDFLNACMQMVFPSDDLNESLNRFNAEQAQKTLFSQMTHEQMYLHLKMMESNAAMASIALSKADKDRVRIELGRREKELVTTSRTRIEREKQDKKDAKHVSYQKVEPEYKTFVKALDVLTTIVGMKKEEAVIQLAKEKKFDAEKTYNLLMNYAGLLPDAANQLVSIYFNEPGAAK